MARIGRFVVPDLPHHVTQRGNRRETVFFGDDDYALYRDLLHEACRREGVAVWAYCLMPNHVHLILAPQTPEALGRALGKAHRRYSAFVNARMRVTGHLFQARFFLGRDGRGPPDGGGALCGAEPGPGKTRRNSRGLALVERARPSRRPRRRAGRGRALARALRRAFPDLLAEEPDPARIAALRAAETIGRPLGAGAFLDRVAGLTGRDPRPGKRGRKRRAAAQAVAEGAHGTRKK